MYLYRTFIMLENMLHLYDKLCGYTTHENE